MDFRVTEGEQRLRDELRELFGSGEVAAAAAAVASDPQRDPRPVYRLLGARGLLAPHWPAELGGRGTSFVEAAAVYEALVRHDVPDALHVISIQTVGSLLLVAGSPEQKARLLPPLARGERYAAVLFTEPEAGSDLGALETVARPAGDGSFLLHGTKTYGLITSFADHGLCAARLEHGSSYESLTLFVVPLDAEGVSVERLPSLPDDPFHQVRLDGVRVSAEDAVGGVGRGWPVLLRALTLERTGLDYQAKAGRWLELLAGAARDGGAGEPVLAELARLAARHDAARLLAYGVLSAIDAGEATEDAAAIAKWYASETAAEVACSAPALVGPLTERLEIAYREAPGARISGGTAEMMLETIARLRVQEVAA